MAREDVLCLLFLKDDQAHQVNARYFLLVFSVLCQGDELVDGVI